jgi:raffinose/stachyose/melibiose transport system substrate-binding protein
MIFHGREKMKKSLKLIPFVVLVSVLASCGTTSVTSSVAASSTASSTAASSASTVTDVPITFLNFKPEVADNYGPIAAAYKAETGMTVTVKTAAQGKYDETLTADMGKDDKPAIFQVNGPVGYSAWSDYCADLTSTALYTNLSDKSLAIKGTDSKVYAVPNTVEGYGIIYNKALTDKYFALTNKSASITVTSMDQVKSYTTLKAVVEDMQSHKADLGVDGVFSATSLKSGEQWRWQTHLFNMPLYGEFGKITAVPKTLNFTYSSNYKNIFDLYLNNSTKALSALATVDVNASMAEVALGKSIMVQNGNWGAGQILGTAGCVATSDNLKFLPIYCGDMGDNLKEANQGLCVGTENYLCVNKKLSADKQAAAIKFLNWLYTGNGKKYVAKAIADGGLGFIPTFTGFTGDLLPSDPLSKEVMNWMSKENTASVPWTFNYIPSENVKNKLGADLLAYANAGMTDAAFATAVSDTKAIWATEAAA